MGLGTSLRSVFIMNFRRLVLTTRSHYGLGQLIMSASGGQAICRERAIYSLLKPRHGWLEKMRPVVMFSTYTMRLYIESALYIKLSLDTDTYI